MSYHVDYANDKLRLLMQVREPDMMEHFVRRLKRMLGPGKHLEQATRGRMEAFLGYDLSHVRVHDSKQAGELAKKLGGEAFTVQSHIFGPPEKLNMQTAKGAGLLAHEITHVIQNTQPKRLSGQECQTRVLRPQMKKPILYPVRGTVNGRNYTSELGRNPNSILSSSLGICNSKVSRPIASQTPAGQIALRTTESSIQRQSEQEALANEEEVRSSLETTSKTQSPSSVIEINPDEIAAKVYRLMLYDLVIERERRANFIARR